MPNFKPGDPVTINGDDGQIVSISLNGRYADVRLVDTSSAPILTVPTKWLEIRNPKFKVGDRVRIIGPMTINTIDEHDDSLPYSVETQNSRTRFWIGPSDIEHFRDDGDER